MPNTINHILALIHDRTDIIDLSSSELHLLAKEDLQLLVSQEKCNFLAYLARINNRLDKLYLFSDIIMKNKKNIQKI